MRRNISRSYDGESETLAEYEERLQAEEEAWEERLWADELAAEDR